MDAMDRVAASTEKTADAVVEIKDEAIPAIRNVSKATGDIAAGTNAIRAIFAPATPSHHPEGESETDHGHEIDAIQGQLARRGWLMGLVTLLAGYRMVGSRKLNVAGVGKGIWGAIKGAYKGVSGAVGKAMPNGDKPEKKD